MSSRFAHRFFPGRFLPLLAVLALPAFLNATNPTYVENFDDGVANNFSGSSSNYTVPTSGTYAYTYFNSTTSNDISLVNGLTWQKNFRLRCSVRNLGTTSAQLAGVVYQRVDSTHYYRVMIDGVGGYKIIERNGGSETVPFSGTYPGGGNDEWAEIEVIKNNANETSVWINGKKLVTNHPQTALAAGQMAVADVGTTARYDNFSVTPMPVALYSEDLSDNVANNWSLPNSRWTVANGIIDRDSTTDSTLGAQEIAFYSLTSWSGDYTASASAWMRFSSSGNEVGMVYNFTDGSNYSEVLINASGQVRLLKVTAGATTSLGTATAYYGSGNKRWQELTVIRKSGLTTVNINGKRVFTNVSNDLSSGKVGVVANFNKGKFDDIVVYDGEYRYKRTFPKLGAIFNGGHSPGAFNYDDDTIAATIAKYDVALLGIYNGWHSNGADVALTKIKNANPAILVGNYVNVMESKNTAPNTSTAGNTSGDAQWDLYRKLSNLDGTGAVGPGGNPTSPAHNDWWAHDPAGTYFIKEFAGQGMTNITYFVTPDSYGYRYPQWYGDWASDLLFGTSDKYDFALGTVC